MPGPVIPKPRDPYDVENLASYLPESVRWASGAALGGLKSILGGSDDPNQMMQVGMPMAAGQPTTHPAIKGAIEGLYSRAQKVADMLPDWVHPAKALSLFKNNASGEELTYRGVPDFLNQTQGRVSKQAVQQYLGEHPAPQVGVKELGEWNGPNRTAQAGDVQYNRPDLNVPGGKNYTETLLKLHIPRDLTADETAMLENNPHILEHHPDLAATKPVFHSTHYPNDPNILVHTREDQRPDQTGALGRFLQEVQSDWHQAGKTHGYQTPITQDMIDAAQSAHAEAEQARLNYVHAHPDVIGMGVGHDPELDRLWDARGQTEARLMDLLHPSRSMVPDAPFKDTWPDLALKKHVLDVARDPELNWLGFTTGETQNQRYNLANRLHEVTYDPEGMILHGYSPTHERVVNIGDIRPNDLHHYIGHDVAERLLQQPLEDYASGSGQAHRLGGIDLQTGGEGMRQFYDKTLPSRLEKILKPFGGRVEQDAVQSSTRQTRNFTVEPVGGQGRIYDAATGEQVAQALPRRPEVGWNQTRPQNQQELVRQLGKQYTIPDTTPAWLARFSPEMKAEILKKGLPLLTLMGMMQPAVSHDQTGAQ